MPNNHQKPDQVEKQYLFDKPENVQRLLRGFYFCCVLLVLAEFVIHRHVYHPWEGLFAFYAAYGFVACVLLVLASTQLRKLVMRDEDYYDPAEVDDEAGTNQAEENHHVGS